MCGKSTNDQLNKDRNRNDQKRAHDGETESQGAKHNKDSPILTQGLFYRAIFFSFT